MWYRNPVLPRNSPDPGALALPDGSGGAGLRSYFLVLLWCEAITLYSSSGYALVTTSNFALNSEGDPALPLYFSTDLV